MKDLFNTPEQLPEDIQAILADLPDNLTYSECEALKAKLEPLGYTFEYGLDCVPYDLKKI